LDDPDELETDAYISFASALWFFMTPQGVKPSMHDVMTNHWIPNAADSAETMYVGFGVTTAILDRDDIECGKGYETTPAAYRYVYFSNFLTEFGLHAGDVSGMSCATYSGFAENGAHGSIPQYFIKKDGDPNKCDVVTTETDYSIYVEDDYKRCICDEWGDGEIDCPMSG